MDWLSIGGIPAHTIGDHGALGNMEVSHVYATEGSGLNYVKWSMDLPRNYWNPAFDKGTPVELFHGNISLGKANMADVDRTNWTFVADGRFRRGERFYPYDTNTPDIPNTVEQITRANEGGLGWNGTGNFPLISWEGRGTESLASVFTEYARSNSLRWGVTISENKPFMEAEPYLYDPSTTLEWAVRPGTPLMPTTDGSYVSRAILAYRGGGTAGIVSTYDHVYSQAAVDPFITPEGGHEVRLITPLNVGAGVAQDMVNEYQRRNALRYTFTQGLEVHPGTLTTPGGTPIENWAACLLVLGRMGVHYGAISTRNNSAQGQTVQWVCGATTYWPGTDRLVISSVDADERTLSKALARAPYRQTGEYYDRSFS